MTLARRMFLASVVLALVVGAVFGALILAISAQSDATERETRSRKITAEVLRLEKLVVDMETGTRGLIITGGNMIFFEPYPQAKRQLPTHLSQLKELVADDPAQRKRANLLDQRIREYAQASDTVIKLFKEEPGIGKEPLILETGRQYTTEIRELADALLQEENRLAVAAATDADRRADIALIVGAVGLAASSALIVLFGLFLARSVGRPVRSVAEGASRLAAGEWSLRLPPRGPARSAS